MKQSKAAIAVERYHKAVMGLYGNEICDNSTMYSDGGWCYVNLAKRFPDGSVGTISSINTNATRPSKLIQMAEELERRAEQ